MERGTFLDRGIQKEFGRFVEIRLHTDGKGAKAEDSARARALLSDRFETLGVPYYAVLDPAGDAVLWHRGGVLSVEEVLQGLRAAAP